MWQSHFNVFQPPTSLLSLDMLPVLHTVRLYTLHADGLPCQIYQHISDVANPIIAASLQGSAEQATRWRFLESSEEGGVMSSNPLEETVTSASSLPAEEAIPKLRDVILGKHPNDAESIKAKEQVGSVPTLSYAQCLVSAAWLVDNQNSICDSVEQSFKC